MTRDSGVILLVIAVVILLSAGPVTAQPDWECIGLGSFSINAVGVHPRNDSLVFAATTSGLHCTSDFGANWRHVSAVSTQLLAVSSGGSDLVFLTGTLFVARSEDPGDTWTAVWTDPDLWVTAPASHPENAKIVYLRRPSGVCCGVDRGERMSRAVKASAGRRRDRKERAPRARKRGNPS